MTNTDDPFKQLQLEIESFELYLHGELTRSELPDAILSLLTK